MLRSVYRTGSSLILDKSNDKDYIYYYDTVAERKKALIKNRNHDNDLKFRVFGSEPKIFLGCYIYPYMELVQGEEIPEFKTFNLLDHKREYVDLLKKYIPDMLDVDKRWYHILIAYYIFKKDNFQDHLDQIQSVHDNGITPELKNTLLKYFKIEEE